MGLANGSSVSTEVRTMEAAMASTSKDERQILMPQPETQVEISSDNGEGISVPSGLSNSIDQTSSQHGERRKRHRQKLWNGSMQRQRKTSSLFSSEVPWRGWRRLRRCFAPDS
jgi:hypothetical protein